MNDDRVPRRRFLNLAALAGSSMGAWALLGCTQSKTEERSGQPSAPPSAGASRAAPSAAPGGLAGSAGSAAAGPPRAWSIARRWDEQLLAAIRMDTPRPPVHARNLYHVSAAVWDAWAAYDPRAAQIFHRERATAANIEVARAEAISYAAYRLIRDRYSKSATPYDTLRRLDTAFAALGYDAANTSTAGSSPAALGNRIFQAVHAAGLADGSNEGGNYAPGDRFNSVNPPLVLGESGTTMIDPNRWQPLQINGYTEQNGLVTPGITVQPHVCPHWASVTAFALRRADPTQPYIDPGPPPMLGGPTDTEFKRQFAQVVAHSSELDPADATTIDISPAAMHNNSLGQNDGRGRPTNPITSRPYPPNVVNRADYARALTEYWADGPQSETPPGHWNVVANEVSDNPLTVKRIGGAGPVVNDLEWDVKLYLALNGAMHDAAIGAWGLKGKYDSVRPVSAIRYLCAHGQCTDRTLPSYSENGIPLQPGLIELVTADSARAGQRHAHLADHIGAIAIRAWRGQPTNPSAQVGGVGWTLAIDWLPFQLPTFVTPAFAGYTSGHSTFSRSGSELLTRFTGSPYFPGGLHSVEIPANNFLRVERGPSQPVRLQWATYFDAADAAGTSRLYGGIHIAADDFAGRVVGSTIGIGAFDAAQRLFAG